MTKNFKKKLYAKKREDNGETGMKFWCTQKILNVKKIIRLLWMSVLTFGFDLVTFDTLRNYLVSPKRFV